MIVLDTNVISETLKPKPSNAVLDWLEAQSEPFALTSITASELLTGVHLLPDGKRRSALAAAVERVISNWGIVLPFDVHAARVYAPFREIAHRAGRGLSVEDGMIAAICVAEGAILATRNLTDFDYLGIRVVNPWG